MKFKKIDEKEIGVWRGRQFIGDVLKIHGKWYFKTNWAVYVKLSEIKEIYEIMKKDNKGWHTLEEDIESCFKEHGLRVVRETVKKNTWIIEAVKDD